MATTTTTTEWSKSKKIVVFSIVGTVIVLSVLGVFIPEAREYVTNIAKILLGSTITF